MSESLIWKHMNWSRRQFIYAFEDQLRGLGFGGPVTSNAGALPPIGIMIYRAQQDMPVWCQYF